MLAELRLPADARPAAGRIPSALRWAGLDSGAAKSVDVHKLFALPGQPATVLAALTRHPPAGMTSNGSSTSPLVHGVGYTPRSLPDWAYEAQLVVNATSGADGTLLRVDAQVLLFPSRSAAEYIKPGQYHVLTVSVTSMDSKPHSKRVVVTSATKIARIVALLNGSHAEPMVTLMCPLIYANYRLTLAATPHSAPAVVLTTTRNSCLGTGVQVRGHKQPTLEVGESLVNAADRLLGYTPQP
jgi:hypothetical protein